jgi:hypothetical protein
MWLFTRVGFFSVVKVRGGRALMVRARRRDDLAALVRFANLRAPIRFSPGADYRYRIFVSRKTWTRVAIRLARDVDYENFKGMIGREVGYDREAIYHRIWATACDLEGLPAPGRPGQPRLPVF